MTKRPVPRIGRVLDAVGALILVAGAAVYARSWLGLRDMESFRPRPGDMYATAIEQADALARLGRIGFALMVAGVAVFLLAAYVARRARA